MSFAHYDEINRICCEMHDAVPPIVRTGFPEGFLPEIKIREEEALPPILTVRLVPRFMPVKEDEAVYMVKYGQLL